MRKFITDILAKANLGVEQNAYVLGTVGIGTSSPVAKFDVNGTSVMRGRLTINKSTPETYGQLNVWDTTAGNGISRFADFTNGTDNNLNFYVSQVGATTKYSEIASYSSNPLVFNNASGGNVGIGTTTPGAKLDVRYDDGVTSGEHNVLASFSRNGTGPLVIGYRANGSSVSSALIRIGDGLPLTIGTTSTNQAFIILDNGNVGIGTTSPDKKLVVVGDGVGTMKVGGPGVGGNYTAISLNGTLDINNYNILSSSSDNHLYINRPTGNDIYFRVNNNDQVSIKSSGNVGIGTDSPASLLHIYSTSGSPQGITIQGGDESFVKFLQGGGGVKNWGLITTNLAAGDFGIYQSTSVGGDPFSAGTAKLYFNNDGNVGIGTTSPSQLLHLQTNLASSSGVGTAIQIVSDGSGGDQAWIGVNKGTGNGLEFSIENRDIIFNTGATTPFGGTERMRITSGGNVGIGITNPGTKVDIGFDANNRSIVRLNSNAANRMAAVTFYGNNVESSTIGYEGGSEIVSGGVQGDLVIRNHLASKNIVLITSGGNVGIGTTTPGYKLDVSGTLGVSGTISFPNITISTSGELSFSSSALNIYTYGRTGLSNAGRIIFNNGTGANLFFGEMASNVYGFTPGAYNSTPVLTMNMSSGNVGIGTTSPSGKLSIVTSGTNDLLYLNSGVNTDFAYKIVSGSDDAFVLRRQHTTQGDLSIMSWTYSGNVGIGTNSPTGRLTIQRASGGAETDIDFLNEVGAGPRARFRFGGTNEELSFWTGGTLTERMRITSGGNVLIGTTTDDGYKLNVNGSIKSQGILFERSPYETRSIGLDSSGWYFYNNSDSRYDMLIDASGNVGIGTTSPNRTLSVNGIVGISSATSNTQQLVFSVDSGASYITSSYFGSSSYVPMYLEAGGNVRLAILTNGNIGIGTSSPAYKLDVNGRGYFGGSVLIEANETSLPLFYAKQTGTSGYTAIQFSGNNGTDIGALTTYNGQIYFGSWNGGNGSSGQLQINKTTGAATFSSSVTASSFGGNSYPYNSILGSGADASTGTIFAGSTSGYASSIDVAGGGATNPNTIIFKTASTEKMRITTGGNVGIGTSTGHYFTTNRTVLNINGTSSSILGLQAGNTTAGYLYSDANDFTISTEGTRNLNLVTAGNAPMVFQTNSTEKMRITSGGNVGIGTTSPAYKLDVAGVIRSTSDIIGERFYTPGFAVPSSAKAVFNNTNYSGPSWNNASFVSGNGATGVMMGGDAGLYTYGWIQGVQTDNGATKGLFLNPLGATVNVGGNLYLNDKITFKSDIWNISTDGYNRIYFANADRTYFGSGNGYEWRNASDVGLAALGNNGNFGIGTTSPGYRLDVNVASTSDALRIQQGGNSRFILNGDGVMLWGGGSANAGYLSWDTSVAIIGGQSGNALALYAAGERMRITSGGNVGIGTTSPGNLLTVNGNVRIVTPTLGGLFAYDAASGGSFIWSLTRYTDTSANDLNVNTLSGFGIRTGVSGLTTSGHQFYVTSSGNVGIGTTAPSVALHIARTAVVSPSIRLQTTDSTTNGSIQWANSSNSVLAFIGSNSNISDGSGNLEFATGGTTTRMVINSAGNVGIGTTSPSDKLNVIVGSNGNVMRLDGPTSGLIIQTNASSADIISYGGSTPAYRALNFSTGASTNMTITTAGNVGIGTTSPNAKLEVVGNINTRGLYFYDGGNSGTLRIDNSYGGGIDYHADQNGHRFFTWVSGTGWVQHFTITDAGNVGIGTASPSYTLDVAGGSGFRDTLRIVSSGTETVQLSWTSTNNGVINVLNGGSVTTQILGNGNSYFNGGNVGIGTTSPQVKFSVQGAQNNTIAPVNGVAKFVGGDAGVFIGNLAGTPNYGAWIQAMRESDGLTFPLHLQPNGGNVGIGTTSPSYKLDVSGALRATGTLYSDNGSLAGNLNLGQVVSIVSSFGSYANLVFTMHNGGGFSDIMKLQGNGNVGIGTTSPLNILHVSQPSAATVLRIGNNSNYDQSIYFNGGNDWSMGMDYSNSNAFVLSNYSSLGTNDRLVVTTGGNVGIGTTSPSYKLHVEGNVSGISIYASHDIAAFSDITVKKEVKRIENAIEKVKELNGYTYVRTDDETGTRRAGVIAQEVQKVLPEVVSANPDGTLNVAYSNMIALLIEGMKEQQKEIDELKKLLKK